MQQMFGTVNHQIQDDRGIWPGHEIDTICALWPVNSEINSSENTALGLNKH